MIHIRIFLFLFAIILTQLHNVEIVEAVKNQIDQKDLYEILNIVKGDWYNNKGDKVVSINNGYLNECRIVSGFDWAGSMSMGGMVLRIEEANGVRDLRLNWRDDEGSGNFIMINRVEHLHKNPTSYFYESVTAFILE